MIVRYLVLACAVFFPIVGCGKRERIEFVGLSGNVMRGDKPLAKGRITLYPLGTTKGPVSGTEITGGKYNFELSGGVPVGTHRVSIHELGPDPKSGGGETNLLPSQFNDLSTLELEVVSGEAAMTKDFDLDKDFGSARGAKKQKP